MCEPDEQGGDVVALCPVPPRLSSSGPPSRSTTRVNDEKDETPTNPQPQRQQWWVYDRPLLKDWLFIAGLLPSPPGSPTPGRAPTPT